MDSGKINLKENNTKAPEVKGYITVCLSVFIQLFRSQTMSVNGGITISPTVM